MGLPALASPSALVAWLGAPVDDERAQAVLAAASTLVRARAGENWVDENGYLKGSIPDGIPTVVVTVAARLWANPTGTTSSATGPFSASWQVGFQLTDAEADMVDAAMGTTSFRGIGTLPTTRGDLETAPVLDEWLPDGIESEPQW